MTGELQTDNLQRRRHRRVAQPSATEPLIVTELGMCYFAAMIGGMKLIEEHAAERPDLTPDFKSDALWRYSAEMGDRLIARLYPTDAALEWAREEVVLISYPKGTEQRDKIRQERPHEGIKWLEVDWTLQDAEISRRLKVRQSTVHYARQRYADGKQPSNTSFDRRSVYHRRKKVILECAPAAGVY